MILVIDTSSPSSSVIATIDGDRMSESVSAGRGLDMDHLRRLARTRRITKVAVASGPGSFTGLRAGVSFGPADARAAGSPQRGAGDSRRGRRAGPVLFPRSRWGGSPRRAG
ncbi:MAG: hypothetical protein E6H95_02320 [Chloroflexi bacterium]|nr:MAG: hypothetical protein E6H95_02320 [Chloroflexota bacterium]